MAELTPAAVAQLLEVHGLTGPAFDVEETTATLNEASELNNSLDPLVDKTRPADPVSFDPRWLGDSLDS